MFNWDGLKVQTRGVWLAVPGFLWRRQIAKGFRDQAQRLAGMSDARRAVRAFVVSELPKVGRPLAPADIAEQLDIPQGKVIRLLGELESGMTYLYRNQDGAVEWAYPVTAAPTPHQLTFDSGEEIWGA
jgi:hypothetical protein